MRVNRKGFFKILGIGSIMALLNPLDLLPKEKVVGYITDVKAYKKPLFFEWKTYPGKIVVSKEKLTEIAIKEKIEKVWIGSIKNANT